MKPPKQVIGPVFLAAAGLLSASMILIYGTGVARGRSEQTMVAQRLILQNLEAFESIVKGAETGQRGYLLTGEEPYLEPYKHALSQVRTNAESLRQSAAASELSPARVNRVIALAEERLTELDLAARLRREQGLREALEVMWTGRGKELMEEIRNEVAQLQAEEQAEFDRAEQRAVRAATIRSRTFVALIMLNFAFLGWAFRKISREMNRSEAAALETSRQKELLATTLACIGDAVVVTDAEGRVTFLNAEARQLTGWNGSEAQGKPLRDIFCIMDGSTRKPMDNPVEKVLRNGSIVDLANDTVLVARDGREISVDDSAAPIRQPGGPLIGVVLVFRDVTEQKRAHEILARSNEELESVVEERTTKLREMISELQHVSYAITHDMRAPLRAMSAFASILSEQLSTNGTPEQMRENCQRIIAAAGRLDKLIQDALYYTKTVLHEMPLQPVDLSELVRDLIETYPNLQSEKADIHIKGNLAVVCGNEALLTQCFSNLLGNAVKFVAPGTRPRVEVEAETRGDMARIWIRDNGIGIPKQAQERLFGMFQRLTDQYEGSGMGLAIVRKVVERMGGSVSVESEPDKGSRFRVDLPLATSR